MLGLLREGSRLGNGSGLDDADRRRVETHFRGGGHDGFPYLGLVVFPRGLYGRRGLHVIQARIDSGYVRLGLAQGFAQLVDLFGVLGTA